MVVTHGIVPSSNTIAFSIGRHDDLFHVIMARKQGKEEVMRVSG